MNTSSIVGRLTLMFAVATAVASTLAGVALFAFQSVELRHHQADELRARLEIIAPLVQRNSQPARWSFLTEKLESFTPQNDSLRYIVQAPDPRYRFGRDWPADARIARNADGSQCVKFAGRTFLAVKKHIPANGQRPDVNLIIASDLAPVRATSLALGLAVLTVSLTAIIAVSLLGRAIARKGLAPLEKLSWHASGLNPNDPGMRLPDDALPAELRTMTAAFNGALERLQHAYERLAAFNADVAHELRTPLGNLIGQTQVVLSRPRAADEFQEVLASNLEELERLRAIINDMLFLARADQGAVAENLAPTSLAALTHKTAEFLDILFEDADVTLEVRGDGHAPAEQALLGRAITNLLDNAIRHGAGPGKVEVSIEDHGSQVCLGVRNRGGPIAEPHLARLFDRFYRPDPSRSSSEDSHGLGLAVVKAVALMHGGSVFARCEGEEIVVGFYVAKAQTKTQPLLTAAE
ncbi:MAG: heavy metal sensor histidine kinase [Caulobacter sp.]|nr:heavy metal sensor histidine kinase [Caulobacter sp.]